MFPARSLFSRSVALSLLAALTAALSAQAQIGFLVTGVGPVNRSMGGASVAAPIDAARAHAVGLVNRVVPLDELHATAQEMGETIAANAPLSVRAAKATVYLAAEHGRRAAWDEADRIWEPVYLSEDAQEGPRAFRDGRPPVWRGV